MVSNKLIRAIKQRYQLDWEGIHGINHWARVRENGLRLAPETAALPEVVELFAVFHDSQRQSEGRDPDHGRRGARLAAALRGVAYHLPDKSFMLLCEACEYHTSGRQHANPTVRTCWDADRLDLGRVGIKPDPRHLCTPAARNREIISWAYQRSVEDHIPSIVTYEWRL